MDKKEQALIYWEEKQYSFDHWPARMASSIALPCIYNASPVPFPHPVILVVVVT